MPVPYSGELRHCGQDGERFELLRERPDDKCRNFVSNNLTHYITEKPGSPTLTDIVSELEKPGRDPRKVFEVFSFTEVC